MINRKTYKAVKKMDRQEMEDFLKNIYRTGFKEGSEVGDNTDFKIKLSKILENTKGVGVTIYKRVMETVKEME